MAAFTVHLPPGKLAPDRIVFLRDGFSLWALAFGPLWLAWNRAWIALVVWAAFVGVVLFAALRLHLGGAAMVALLAAMALGLGFEGVRLVAWDLARRGFHESAVVVGESADEAEEIWFRRRADGESA